MKNKINYILSGITIIFIIFGSGIKVVPSTEEFKFVDDTGDTFSIVAGNSYEAINMLYLDLPKQTNLKLLK